MLMCLSFICMVIWLYKHGMCLNRYYHTTQFTGRRCHTHNSRFEMTSAHFLNHFILNVQFMGNSWKSKARPPNVGATTLRLFFCLHAREALASSGSLDGISILWVHAICRRKPEGYLKALSHRWHTCSRQTAIVWVDIWSVVRETKKGTHLKEFDCEDLSYAIEQSKCVNFLHSNTQKVRLDMLKIFLEKV